MKTALRIVLLICVGNCCLRLEGSEKNTKAWYEKLTVAKDPRTKFVLFSWAGTDGSYRFALIPNNDDRRQYGFLNKFDRRRTPSITLEELRLQLARLPADSLVTWTRYKPNGIGYPNQKIVHRIKKWCAGLHLDLQFNEPIDE